MTPSMTAWPPTRVVSSPLSRIGISWVWVKRRKYVRRDTDPLRILLYQSRSPSFATFRTLPHKAEPYATLPHRYTQTPAALISSTPPPTLAAKRPGCATSRIGTTCNTTESTVTPAAVHAPIFSHSGACSPSRRPHSTTANIVRRSEEHTSELQSPCNLV